MTQAIVEKTVHDVALLPALWEKQEIKDHQDKIKSSLSDLDHDLHIDAIQCFMHAHKHGDTSLMTRLLIDIVGADSGYRRQAMIGWMRTYTPIELVGKVCKLTGVDPVTQKRRDWRIAEANQNPFRRDKRFAEALRPIYKSTLLSKINLAMKDFKASVKNTVYVDGPNGTKVPTAIDQSKPFYDGINVDKMTEFFAEIENKVVEIEGWEDKTLEARKAKKALFEAEQAMREVAA